MGSDKIPEILDWTRVCRKNGSLFFTMASTSKAAEINTAILLSDFNFKILYNKGAEMEHLDCLSRPSIPDQFEETLYDNMNIQINQLKINDKTHLRKEQEDDPETQKFRSLGMPIEEKGTYTFQGRPFIPKSMRDDLLISHHYSIWGGHPGSSKMLKKIAKMYFWSEMRKDVRQMTKNCLTCARRSGKHPSLRQPNHHLARKELFETVALGLIGPFIINNHKYWVLTKIDHLSKWSEADILTKTSAGDIAKAFITTWISRYGVPKRVLTDRGANFIAAFDDSLWNEACYYIPLSSSRKWCGRSLQQTTQKNNQQTTNHIFRPTIFCHYIICTNDKP